jgi:hypothetical protein
LKGFEISSGKSFRCRGRAHQEAEIQPLWPRKTSPAGRVFHRSVIRKRKLSAEIPARVVNGSCPVGIPANTQTLVPADPFCRFLNIIPFRGQFAQGPFHALYAVILSFLLIVPHLAYVRSRGNPNGKMLDLLKRLVYPGLVDGNLSELFKMFSKNALPSGCLFTAPKRFVRIRSSPAGEVQKIARAFETWGKFIGLGLS